MPQKSPKLGERRVPAQLKTSSSESDPLHHRPITDRSPKLGGDRRSPRGSQSDPVNQKKLGTRIAGLESQLEQAQEELKLLKDQLVSAEAAKQEAQQELEKKTKKPKKEAQLELEKNPAKPGIEEPEAEALEKHSQPSEIQESNKTDDNVEDDQHETDVFEVPVEKAIPEPKVEQNELKETAIPEPEKPVVDELALKNDEINILKDNLEAKDKELEALSLENVTLKAKVNDAASEISSSRVKEEEMQTRLNQLMQELEASKSNTTELKGKLAAVEGSKEALESEMKRLRVQTDQWRKAADAAAAVLAGGVELNGRRISERCGSMDKHYSGAYEAKGGGYAGFVGSPGLGEDSDDGFGSVKRKGSGIRMFGDLWKKKSQK